MHIVKLKLVLVRFFFWGEGDKEQIGAAAPGLRHYVPELV